MDACVAIVMYCQRLFLCLLVNNIVHKQLSMTSLVELRNSTLLQNVVTQLICFCFQDMSVESEEEEEEEEEENTTPIIVLYIMMLRTRAIPIY